MPPNRAIYQVAAILALTCIAIMAFAFGSPYAVQTLQPTLPDAHNADFYYATLNNPRSVLAFMAIDTLFIFSYFIVFVGLYESTKLHGRLLASIALGFGLAAGVFDMLENSYLTSYALQGLYDHKLGEPALPLIYVLASMKWLSVFFTIFLYALLWERDSVYNRILSALMLAFPLLGVLSIAIPELLAIRVLPLVISIAMLAWSFRSTKQ